MKAVYGSKAGGGSVLDIHAWPYNVRLYEERLDINMISQMALTHDITPEWHLVLEAGRVWPSTRNNNRYEGTLSHIHLARLTNTNVIPISKCRFLRPLLAITYLAGRGGVFGRRGRGWRARARHRDRAAPHRLVQVRGKGRISWLKKKKNKFQGPQRYTGTRYIYIYIYTAVLRALSELNAVLTQECCYTITGDHS